MHIRTFAWLENFETLKMPIWLPYSPQKYHPTQLIKEHQIQLSHLQALNSGHERRIFQRVDEHLRLVLTDIQVVSQIAILTSGIVYFY